MPGRRSVVVAAASLVLAAAVSACGSGGSAAPGTRTVTVRPSSPHLSAVDARASAPPARRQTRLRHCETALPLVDVQRALGTLFSGRTQFVVGVREPNIGRLSYINCRYGIPAAPRGAAQPLIEIGVSLYETATDAQQRVRATVFDYLGSGARHVHTAVAGHPAELLVDGSGRGYSTPVLVVAAAQRTVAVSLATRAGTAAYRRHAMAALAELALRRTAG